MNKMTLNTGRQENRRGWLVSVRSVGIKALAGLDTSIVNTIRRAVDTPKLSATRTTDDQTVTDIAPMGNDRWRQVLNVIFAVGQAVTTVLVYALGVDQTITSNDAATTTPLVPAGYAFAIWGLIYGSTIAYSMYQALPQQRTNPLLRSIGWWTAPAFLGTSVWLVTAVNEWYWTTVAVFFGILVALLGAFIQLIRYNAPRTLAERFLIVLPISIYTGWASVATVANTSTALKATGFNNMLFADTTWAVIMLLVAGLIGSFVTFVSKGNVAYALTVVWALVGIVVANVVEVSSIGVAITAGCMAATVVAVLLISQWRLRVMRRTI